MGEVQSSDGSLINETEPSDWSASFYGPLYDENDGDKE
jgi:hypothetical protein